MSPSPFSESESVESVRASLPPVQRVGVRLAGTGMAVPQRILHNDDLAKIVDTNDEWITQRTGIKTRRIVENGTTVRHLAHRAVEAALANAGIAPTELDALICATMTPEMVCPSTAARLVADLGATPAGAFDVSAACSGFVYSLNIASAMIQSGHARTVAVVGAETLSKITDYTDRSTCILFGDGAGAAVLTASDDPTQGSIFQMMYSDGRSWHDIYVPRDRSNLPEHVNGTFSGNFDKIQMNGREVFKFAVNTLNKAIDEALQRAGVTADDIAMVVPHQSNIRILQAARERLGLPEEKIWINIDRFGNTSAASVPICLHEIMEQGRVKKGDLLLFIAIGGGLTWATNIWRL